jgi:V/A-type H+-transporting ATPase subunit D
MRGLGGGTATRLNLLRSRRRLERVREGEALLSRKREALVRELLSHARPAVDARERIGRAAAAAYPALLDALADEGASGVTLSAQPTRDVPVEVRTMRVCGLTVGAVDSVATLERTLEARGTLPGPTPHATILAAERFETFAQRLLDAAPREMLLRRLGHAVARTSRQVRALELRVEPELAASVTTMSNVLDEREREEHLRLRHFLRRRRADAPATR